MVIPPYPLPSLLAREHYPEFTFPRHVQAFQRATVDLLYGPVNRQIITVPVRHGKSAWHSVIVPAWFVLNNPDKLVLLTGYGADLTSTFAVQARELVREAAPRMGLALDPNHQSRTSFRLLGHRGGLDSAGAKGPINGKGYHLIVGDDLVKDEEAARSPVERASLLNWWMGDALRRGEPNAKVSLIMSRKHPSDIVGEMLAMNAELPPSKYWHQVLFRAIDDEGKALWPERYPVTDLLATKRELELANKSHFWSSMYQQDPRSDPAACEYPDSYFGGIFYDELPPGVSVRLKVVTCDPSKGSKSKAGDYSAILTLILDRNGTLWVDDIWMRQVPLTEAVEQFAATIVQQRPHGATVETMLGGELAIQETRRILDAKDCRVPLYPYQSTDNKNVRIRIALTQWLAEERLRVRDTVGGRLFVGQLREFPSGEHDDGPDACAMGVSLLDSLLS